MVKDKNYFENKLKRLAELNYSIIILHLDEFKSEKEVVMLELDSYGLFENNMLIDKDLSEFYFKQCEILMSGNISLSSESKKMLDIMLNSFLIGVSLFMCILNLKFGLSYFIIDNKNEWVEFALKNYERNNLLWLLPFSSLFITFLLMYYIFTKMVKSCNN